MKLLVRMTFLFSENFLSAALSLIAPLVFPFLSPLCVEVTSHLRGSLSGSSEKKFVRTLVSIKP